MGECGWTGLFLASALHEAVSAGLYLPLAYNCSLNLVERLAFLLFCLGYLLNKATKSGDHQLLPVKTTPFNHRRENACPHSLSHSGGTSLLAKLGGEQEQPLLTMPTPLQFLSVSVAPGSCPVWSTDSCTAVWVHLSSFMVAYFFLTPLWALSFANVLFKQHFIISPSLL